MNLKLVLITLTIFFSGLSFQSFATSVNRSYKSYKVILTDYDRLLALTKIVKSFDDGLELYHTLRSLTRSIESLPTSDPNREAAIKLLPTLDRQTDISKRLVSMLVNEPTESGSFRLAVSRSGGVPMILATINGRKTAMLLDTGASHTLLPRSVAQGLKLKTYGSLAASTANGNTSYQLAKVDLGLGSIVRSLEVAVADRSDVGLLGQDVLSKYILTIDRDSVQFKPLSKSFPLNSY